ncbi:hypothetical protein J4558_24920 [Leptolyngbya sp. 15MV]|nr:hypothetical protein J4558_24920 [Leptolyngbya sp. 15MV]
MLIALGPMPGRALLLVNDTPLAFIDRGPGHQTLIPADRLKSGANSVQLAFVPDDAAIIEATVAAATNSARFFEAVAAVTEGAEWAFARWEPPRASAFQKAKSSARNHGPSWWKCHFRPVDAHAPLYVELTGMTKGQIYVNGRHLGRYFTATPDGKPVQPRTTPMIPSCWLRAGEDNELLLFDEHGGSPAKVQLLYEPVHA